MDQANIAIVAGQLNAWLVEQPFWKRYANTVTGAVAGALLLVWWIASTSAGAPEWVSTLGGVLGFLALVVGLKFTRNGMTPSTLEQTLDRLTPDEPPPLDKLAG